METKKFDKEYERAVKAGERANATEPRAASARYDSHSHQVIVRLRNGEDFAFSPELVPNLRGASASDLAEVEVTPSGAGLHWERLDEDLSVPALVKGIYGPQTAAGAVSHCVSIEFPEDLCVRMEAAWITRRDDKLVDRLAAEHPEHAAALYEFFALLVESELAAPLPQEDVNRSAARAQSWLEEEGFALASSIAREQREKTPETSPPPPADSGNVQELKPRAEAKAQAAPLAYIGLIQERMDRDVDEVTELAPIIRFVQKQPADRYIPVRKQILKIGAEKWGIGEEEGDESLSLQWRSAALRRSDANPMTYEEVVNRSRLSAEDKKFWLALGSEDSA
jgi:hypothetical protein